MMSWLQKYLKFLDLLYCIVDCEHVKIVTSSKMSMLSIIKVLLEVKMFQNTNVV